MTAKEPVKPSAASTAITRRTLLVGGAALAAPLAFPRPAIAEGAKIRYTLSWLPTGQYAYVYMARQLGYWKKRGIEVDIVSGRGSLGAIQGIASGQFELGGAATGANLLSITKGVDLRILGTQGYDASLGVLVPAKGPIKKPKDIEGRKIGVTAAGGDTPFLPAYYKLAGVDANKVTTVALDSKIIEEAVMSGQVDCMVAFGMSSIPNFVSADFPVRFLPFADVGIQFYWVNTLARSEYLEKNKPLIADFQDGLFEGMKFALLNPEETVERHLKEHEEIAISKNGKLFTELGVGMVSACMNAPESREHGLGYTDLDKLAAQAKLARDYTGAATDPQPPPVASYASNDLIGKVALTAAEWDVVHTKTKKYAELLGRV
ncbi:MAG TPA: ABC transporter substrate-binding protein [Candidatus Sulfotelmatobacter sp.]|nr:ABC transporter substrate-binding protein [Candidatus Sulfotelmatobacter sp.]